MNIALKLWLKSGDASGWLAALLTTLGLAAQLMFLGLTWQVGSVLVRLSVNTGPGRYQLLDKHCFLSLLQN